MKREVELLPPAFVNTIFASSNMKCADASLGWLGTVGMIRVLPLYLKMVYGDEGEKKFVFIY